MLVNIQTNFKNCSIEKRYKRNGVGCLLDPTREILVIETPEEVVRQRIIQCLIKEYQVPLTKIASEVPMSHFSKGAKGRADIIIYGENKQNINVPVMVIECKAPTVPLTDDVWDQVQSYDEVLGSGFILITNGDLTYGAKYDEEDNMYCYIEKIPKYVDLISGADLKYVKSANVSWKRPDFELQPSNYVIEQFKDLCWIGEDTDEGLYPFLVNLIGFIQETDVKFTPFKTNMINAIEDGARYTSFGNAAGGSWTGDYRYFIIEDLEGNNQIVSFSILGSAKTSNDAHWGSRKGRTILIVAIDDFDKRHNSLQLNIDKYARREGNNITIWHDGTITVGKNGAASRSELIDFICSRDKSLVNEHNEIILGCFNCTQEISWTQPESKNFIGNVIKYALLRDAFRRIKDQNKDFA